MIEAIGMMVLVGGAVTVGLVPSRPLANCDPDSAYAQLTRRTELRGTVALATIGATLGFALIAYASGRSDTAMAIGLAGSLAFAALHPWPWIRLAIPLGLWRVAAALSRFGGSPWLRDPIGGSVLAGAMACARKRRPAVLALAELERRLADGPLRGAGIVAAGLIAHERGDVDAARALMTSIDDLEPDILPPFARRVAFDWRIADATARGEWAEILRIGQDALALSRTARLLVLVAHRFEGAHVSRRTLVSAWLRAPRRRHTWALLRAAMRAPVLPQRVADDDLSRAAANGGGLLGTAATSLHIEAAEAAARGHVPDPLLHRLGEAWDASLYDFDVRRKMRARALALGCRSTVEGHVVALHRNLCRDIAAFVRGGLRQPMTPCRSLARALDANRTSEHASLLRQLKALDTAQRAEVGPPTWRLWLTWLGVRDTYERAALGAEPEAMRGIFVTLERCVAPFVGWLWVTRGERGLANALSYWLVREAERVRHRDAAAHHRSWVAAGP